MAKYPIFLELGGRRVVVVGGGGVAARKARVLLDVGASLVVVAARIGESMRGVCGNGDAEIIECVYSNEYLSGAVLVIAATDDEAVNGRVFGDCRELGILCNIVDVPELCDFYVPAVVDRGCLKIAISTDGACPAYAGQLRKKLENMFTEQHGQFLEELRVMRIRIIDEVSDAKQRKCLLDTLVGDRSFGMFSENGLESWRVYADDLVRSLG